MISYLLRIRVNFLIRTSILNRRLSTVDINDNEDYSLSTIMTDSVQVKEGKANIHLPEGAVFYNPAQVFNRDLSVACLRLVSKYHHENECKRIKKNDPNAACVSFDQLPTGVRQENGLKIAEALSATGLRSIRYAREIPGIDTIYANDIDAGAVESIKQNIELNDVKHLVQASHDDAMNLLYSHRKPDNQFHVVDLDPYGTPGQFLDGAVQCIKKNGVICITATDMASLCGNNPHRSALLNAGYRVSTSHARQDSIKTNAPHHVIWDIMRAFAELSSTKRASTERLNTESPYYRLLTKPSTIQVDFTEHPDWESEARKNKLIRFMGNPHARWGPLGKAVTKNKRSSEDNDSIQNKKQAKSDEDSPTEEVL
ncbi:unnamed protein product [Rotaria magnacalcarata]|uniref:tRNA (guanine(26)-N(2))-dimethyltransferase n=1 Tax=Rotaria magnacalcarata TaxID=392030 RepID=A0A8S2LAF1_9BILA|nr:unnamed protein product [Rotaria magnacalcarata]CAF3903153.1 unnamed protein product [Rotaria magnacalcarata]